MENFENQEVQKIYKTLVDGKYTTVSGCEMAMSYLLGVIKTQEERIKSYQDSQMEIIKASIELAKR